MKKKKYTPPSSEVFALQKGVKLLANTGNGEGNLPPTTNDNNDNDW